MAQQPTQPPLPQPLRQLAVGPIFVVGQPRSGTTWIYDILAAHPEAAGVFESWLFTTGQGIGGLFSKAHWNPRIEQDRETFGKAYRLNQLMTRDELVAEMRELTARWLSAVLEPHHRFLVEKTPAHHGSMPMIAELFPQARFIHVLRDGRDVAVSLRAAAESWGKGYFKAPPAYEGGKRWQSTVRYTRSQGEALDVPFLEVRYEDVRADPHGGIARLLDFCSMPHDDGLVARIVEQTDIGRERKRGEDRFRRRGAVGDWRARFRLRDRLMFELGSGGLLAEAGYERNRLWWLRRPRAASDA